MRNKIIFRMILVIIICTSILMLTTYNLLKENYYNKETEYLEIIMDQLLKVLDTSEEKEEYAISLFLEDYLNRLSYIKVSLEQIKNDYLIQSVDDLLKTADINYYYEVDKNGVIQESNDLDAIGVDFYENEKLSEFIPLIEGTEEKGYHLILNGTSINSGKTNSYLGIALEDGGMLLIEIHHDKINEYLKNSTVEYVISNMPTKESEMIFAIDSKKDKLLSISKNNEQKVEIENRVETLKKAIDKPITTISNSNEVILYAREYNNVIIGMSTALDTVMQPLQTIFEKVLGIILILYVLICVTIFLCIKKINLDDLLIIRNKIIKFFKFKNKKTFSENKLKDMTVSTLHVNDMLDIIASKENSISNIVTYIGNNFAAYEYYPKINQLFYSDNMPKMFGLNNEECKQAALDIVSNLSNDLKNGSETVEYTAKSGRTVRVKRRMHNNIFYGFVEDITEIKEKESLLQEQLIKEKEISNLDPLTGLYNRKMIEDYFSYLCDKHKQLPGIMLLIDLDNFKNVNDEYGHLEGDKVLKKLAEIINKSFRHSDIKARLGGDEFMVYITDTIPMDALEIKIKQFISKVRKELEEYYTKNDLSVSVGAVGCNKDCITYEELYHMSDVAMYVAKRCGKDGYYINKEFNMCNGTVCIKCKEKCDKRSKLFE